MMTPADVVADNVQRVRQRIAAAAEAAGRDPQDVRLVAVCKYVDVPTTELLIAAGCCELGESRPQALWAKAAAPQLAAATWHLVGRLQRNKVRRTLPLVRLIHSVDSERLLAAINAEAIEYYRHGAPCNVNLLLEVNCSGESSKQGFSADEVRRLVPQLASYPYAPVVGLMTMAALEGSSARSTFAALRILRDELSAAAPPGVHLNHLSMGMSGDFESAIAEGATIVRIGSFLFEGLP